MSSAFLHTLAGVGSCCRFSPTCSHYFESAIEHHGPVRGSAMGIWRLLRCGPWSVGGHDPVRLKGMK